MSKKSKLLVIGAGLSGLTTAFTLAKKGHDVTVLFKDSFDIVSQVAAAIWVLPLDWVFRFLKDTQMKNKLEQWAFYSYHKLKDLALKDPTSGVVFKDMLYVFRTKILDSPLFTAFMEKHKRIPGFRHSADILREKGISGSGLVDCFSYPSPFVDTDAYLQWLTKGCKSLGVRFQRRTINGLLSDNVDSLKKEFNVDFLVNCTGLGARDLVGDKDVYPGVGAAFVFQNKDKSPPIDFGIDCLTTWAYEEFPAHGRALIAPRGSNGCWIGTTIAENADAKQLHPNHSVVQIMLNECFSIYPKLQDIVAGQRMIFKVGSRPMRKGSPRVERDDQCQSIIHNYGHSSLGCILSWGSAEEVLSIVENIELKMASKL